MLNENILIKEIPDEDKFGIKSDNLSVKAEIINIGPDVTEIAIGDIVYLSRYSGIPYKAYRIVELFEVLGKEL